MPKIKSLTIASLIGVGFMPLAQAADQPDDDRWYIAPFASYVQTGGDRRSDQGWGGGLGVGKILDRHFNLEIKGFYEGFNGQNGVWSLTGGTADLQYYFFRDKFSPYAVVAAGGMNSCVGSSCGAGIIGEAGLGFTYELNDNFLLRSDVRYRYNNNMNNHIQSGTTEFNDMTVNVGFVIPFGEKPQRVAKAEPRPEPIVTAPAPAPKPDPCHGRHFKSDKVDANGCPVIVLRGEHFKFDSAVLMPTAKEILDNLARELEADPQKSEIEARGYASSEGGKAYNLRLSERRARSVVEYLKSKGVTNKLIAKGFGIADPVADNSTEEGRVQNRRVELIWIQE
ncbi:MAG: OmpA family protein [Methylomonas sp.]|jgi:OOP family OmpA-OmpF porin